MNSLKFYWDCRRSECPPPPPPPPPPPLLCYNLLTINPLEYKTSSAMNYKCTDGTQVKNFVGKRVAKKSTNKVKIL